MSTDETVARIDAALDDWDLYHHEGAWLDHVRQALDAGLSPHERDVEADPAARAAMAPVIRKWGKTRQRFDAALDAWKTHKGACNACGPIQRCGTGRSLWDALRAADDREEEAESEAGHQSRLLLALPTGPRRTPLPEAVERSSPGRMYFDGGPDEGISVDIRRIEALGPRHGGTGLTLS